MLTSERRNLSFPPPASAGPDGLLAAGGDLLPDRLLLAYAQGIFPWYSAGEPILWWSPMPRCILFPGGFRCNRTLRKAMRHDRFSVTFNRDFSAVIRNCASSGSRAAAGTWIDSDMIAAYERFHRLGYAVSVEVWRDGQLAGGLYGVTLGRAFFGESMFHRVTHASKVGLAMLSIVFFGQEGVFIDLQLPTSHLQSLGGLLVDRPVYDGRLAVAGVNPEQLSPSEIIWPTEEISVVGFA